MKGTFSEEALLRYVRLVSQTQSADFSEGETYDFTTCIRPDGSAYGTGGTCRKGTPGEARKEARVEMIKQRKEVSRLQQAREEAAGGEDKKAAAEARRQHIEAKNKLKELQKKHESLREESGDLRRFGAEANRYKATDDELKQALDSGKLSANTALKVRVELAQRKADLSRTAQTEEGAPKAKLAVGAEENKAIKQLGGMLPKGEKIMDSKGGLHTAAGKVKEVAAKKPQ